MLSTNFIRDKIDETHRNVFTVYNNSTCFQLWGSKGYNFACRFQSFLKESQGINSRQEPRGKNWSRGQGERMLADLHPGFVYSSILRSGTDHSELDPLPTISKKK